MNAGTAKRFDADYFKKWYRHPAHRVGSRADLERLVRFALAAAEYVLARPVRSVLDVGAGEGRWQPVLRTIRPSISYIGVDPSEYATRRFGRTRNLRVGTAEDLESIVGDRTFDLVVSCSMLNYLPRPDMARAVKAIARHTGGLAYLEIFTSVDEVRGDTNGWHAETPALYRRVTRSAGLIECGMHCYVPNEMRENTVALERAERA